MTMKTVDTFLRF